MFFRCKWTLKPMFGFLCEEFISTVTFPFYINSHQHKPPWSGDWDLVGL